MDNTETYIKMADCEEIQKEHRYLEGNDYHLPREWRGEEFWIRDHPKRTIWLPRQDQLQEMSNTKPSGILLSNFYNWYHTQQKKATLVVSDKLAFSMSMEQLWLAFVMKEKYNKIWENESWITMNS